MSEDKPKFKPNVSLAGARRSRGRARSAQLVPQRGVGRGVGRGQLRPQPPGQGQSVPLSELRRLEVSGRGGVKSEVHEVSTGSSSALDAKKEEVLLARLKEDFDSEDEIYDVKPTAGEQHGASHQTLQPASLPLLPQHAASKASLKGSAVLEPGISMLQLPAAMPLQLSAIRNMNFDRMEGLERGNPLLSDLRTIAGEKVKFGKLRVYKSGKVKLSFGDMVEMIVEPGASCQFAQHLFEINTSDGEATEVAEINDRFVAVPDLEKLLIDTPEVKPEPIEISRKSDNH
eukprot:Plantae.Rhodophyta-Purpureofilum_apyrenoidigerum.ctg16087.p1 GENE.Plantae.Rhodophyta-Purpureofilum_apyrenoidigerum.ctg16087~~Plantae.Rhodophyta-Purpureofilum_apyrenoidigerum.ctg16087.p1  ORF type:complete len:287 (+),score=45.77 Plantae.Rhodophyta-Purpureofilum_apyrenoidigerum.ctg16087:26-886(+)